MGNILISLNQEEEDLLRNMAQKKYGSKKGSISTIIKEALNELKTKEKRENAKRKFLETIEKGINLGFKGKVYSKREEIYD
ncbi:hypothetical protein HYU23_02810 [Candidatus Woesearchaeota archaeon]|nr:hypothetical protein [Candidatus Woesearchaeota archaeon]